VEIARDVAAALVFSSGIPLVLIGRARARWIGAVLVPDAERPVLLREPSFLGAQWCLAVIAGVTLASVVWVALLAVPVWVLLVRHVNGRWVRPDVFPDPDPHREATTSEPASHVRVVS
jgi:hypothetical protein